MTRKRGKLSTEEEKFIRDNADSLSLHDIAIQLNRTETTISEYCNKHRLTHAGMSEERYDDTILKQRLEERPYWAEVTSQFTDHELEYFCETWIRMIKQFREDILYSEELQVKQWITLEIMSNSVMKERKRAKEQVDRLQELLDVEYNLPVEQRDGERIAGLETELSMVRNSLGSYTTEHSKILDRIKDIQKELKAARADRVKKVEDSKSSWAGLMKALEDEVIRERLGNDIEVMRMAKDQAKVSFAKFHKYEDGQIDQPFLTPETVED